MFSTNRSLIIFVILDVIFDNCDTGVIMAVKEVLHETEWQQALRKKRNFPLRISSVNVTKSAGNLGFSQIN